MDRSPDESGTGWTVAKVVVPGLEGWNAVHGWSVGTIAGNPYPSANLLALLLLENLAANAWASPDAIEQWIAEHNPFWAQLGRAVENKNGSLGPLRRNVGHRSNLAPGPRMHSRRDV